MKKRDYLWMLSLAPIVAAPTAIISCENLIGETQANLNWIAENEISNNVDTSKTIYDFNTFEDLNMKFPTNVELESFRFLKVNNTTLKFAFKIRYKKNKNIISKEIVWTFKNLRKPLKSDIHNAVKSVRLLLKNKDANVLNIKNGDIGANWFDSSLFKFQVNKVEAKSLSTVNVTYQLVSTTDENLKSKEVTKELKIKNIPSDIQEQSKKLEVSVHNKQAKNIDKLTRDDFIWKNLDTEKFNLNFSFEKLSNHKVKVNAKIYYKDKSHLFLETSYVIDGFGTNKEEFPDQDSKKRKVLWGHWNILNASSNGRQENKLKLIASIIKAKAYDLIGLTEVKDENVAKKLVEHLNKFYGKKVFSYLTSQKLKGSYAGPKQAEYVSVLYRHDRLKPAEFDNKKIGYQYTEKFSNEYRSDVEYVRPPYGVKFNWIGTGRQESFTFVFDHFDSPGKGRSDKHQVQGIGDQELSEALQIAKVLQKFDEMDGPQSNVFFSGDTNIKRGKADFAFKTLKEYGYKMALEDTEENASSLSNTKGKYANPYDKIIYKTELTLNQAFVYKLWDVDKDDSLKPNFYESGFNSNDASKIRSRLSDHCPVGATIDF
ncbi:endonuclease/exonuclease/phosphatase family protein [Metamycoplasma buccale]|uniref:endonuclease/exonuclease/phosphatase family protein n=1 Tax=Metamycoplasma buccale TaxID=55602 RepID=UPI00398F1C06